MSKSKKSAAKSPKTRRVDLTTRQAEALRIANQEMQDAKASHQEATRVYVLALGAADIDGARVTHADLSKDDPHYIVEE